jgi:hypothetical protein
MVSKEVELGSMASAPPQATKIKQQAITIADTLYCFIFFLFIWDHVVLNVYVVGDG